MGILREKEARAWRRSNICVISSPSLLLNDQASWVKEIPKDFKVRTKLKISLNDIWVRKTLIHPWVLLMVGLGLYLDVFGSESHVLVWVLRIFWRKIAKRNKEGKTGQIGPSPQRRMPCCGEAKGQNGHLTGSL